MDFFARLNRWIGNGLRRMIGLQPIGPGGYQSQAASHVSWDTAMQLSGVWACVKLIAETVASLPLGIYVKNESGRVLDTSHPLAILFAGKPNRYQTRVEFFETVVMQLVLHGNAYCLIDRNGGRITSLMPLMSAQMEVELLADGSYVYRYQTDATQAIFAPESIWHLKMMGNGLVGLSVLEFQRNTLGIAQAAEEATTKIYRNGAKPSGVLSFDRALTPQQRDMIRANFDGLTSGEDARLLVLEAGGKFEAVSMSPQDIELLASRKFQLSEICRWYGVPSVMVNDSNGTSVWGSGIEQIVAGFYKLTLRPILEKIECSMMASLFSPAERLRYEAEFDFEGLLRSDQKSRLDGYRIGIQGGIMTPNEARRQEGLPDMEGGDTLYMQGATVPIDNLGRPPTETV
jgi:HK97 family phage portal protein